VTDFTDREALVGALDDANYLVDEGLSTALFLAQALRQPLLLEGEPGVGKTTAAKAMAAVLGGPFVRLQCYEGISVSEALYEWNYAQQLLAIRIAEASSTSVTAADLCSEAFLLDRPLLQAVRHPGPIPAVLLIDEIDRADDEFEALLLEFLGEQSVTVPELGTFHAVVDPVVILTSNRSRELHDALKRRCLYHWIEFPAVERVADIVRRNVPDAAAPLVSAATAFVARARHLDLDKPPGISEVIDWVGALYALGITRLDDPSAQVTLSAVTKTPDDHRRTIEAMSSQELTVEEST
jgi:MoxR-like ATPase